MAGTGAGKYSTTAGNNTSVQSVNWSEGMAPSNVNNAARETIANVRAMYNQIGEGFYEFGDGDAYMHCFRCVCLVCGIII